MATSTGERFLLVTYDPAKCDWGHALAEAYRTHGPGAKNLPCVAAARGSTLLHRLFGPQRGDERQRELFTKSEVDGEF
jgi:hypothetical protein